MVRPSHKDGAHIASMLTRAACEPARSAPTDGPPVLPGPPCTHARIAVLCLPEHAAFAERELAAPLLQAGFQVTLGPIPPRRAPGWLPEILDPSWRVVLLDLTPQVPGAYDLCTELRDRLGLPLMLVLHGAAGDDLLRGYESGADSCLLAPFDVREFLARLTALLRRQPQDSIGT